MSEQIEQTGTIGTLLALLERNRYITELIRSTINPSGVASEASLKKVRYNLQELGLVTEEIEEGPRPKTYLVITEKGKRVAQKLSEILQILEEDW
jgi:DNA-binding PadR family transcriptional regulator